PSGRRISSLRHGPRRAEARPTAEELWVGLQADAFLPHRHEPRRAEARPAGSEADGLSVAAVIRSRQIAAAEPGDELPRAEVHVAVVRLDEAVAERSQAPLHGRVHRRLEVERALAVPAPARRVERGLRIHAAIE